jgi:hypothetical protein
MSSAACGSGRRFRLHRKRQAPPGRVASVPGQCDHKPGEADLCSILERGSRLALRYPERQWPNGYQRRGT